MTAIIWLGYQRNSVFHLQDLQYIVYITVTVHLSNLFHHAPWRRDLCSHPTTKWFPDLISSFSPRCSPHLSPTICLIVPCSRQAYSHHSTSPYPHFFYLEFSLLWFTSSPSSSVGPGSPWWVYTNLPTEECHSQFLSSASCFCFVRITASVSLHLLFLLLIDCLK